MTTSLLEIMPQTRKVAGVTVTGISVRGLAILFREFPELSNVLITRENTLTAEDLLNRAPDAVAQIIAAGTGHPGEPEYVAAADKMSLELQLDFIAEIIKATMPNGVNPFLEKFARLTGTQVDADLSAQQPEEPQDTKSAKPSKL